jgi:hypothetical protein
MMDWTQVLTIVGANIAFGLTMFLWLRGESNNDRREIHQILREIKEDGNRFRLEMSKMSNEFHFALATESKDFHARLVAIEERRTKILEK